MLIATAALASTASAALPQMGPVDTNDTKFPTWYGDGNGLALQLCLDGLPNCLASHADLIEAHAAGGDGEGFYYAADADVGPITVANHLEAAYAADGVDQEITFMRTQISDQTAGTLTAGGKYTVTDPYGVLTCTADALGEIRNNACRTETTIVPLEFARAQVGRIGPFLTWDTYGQPLGGLNPPPPAGYIGDNTTPHKVTGSPTGFNKVRIVGPGINTGATDACPDVAGAISDCAETDLFIIQGKVQPSASATTSTSALDYGNVAAGTPVTKSITYTSTGAQPVTVSSVTLGGTNPTDFAVAENCTTAATGIASGTSCKIDVTYTPRAGTSAATLTIVDNTAGSPRTITLSGSSTPNMTVDTPSIAFGSQKVRTSSAPEIVTVGNDGVAPLTVASAALSGTGSAHFKIDSNGCTTPVAPNGAGCEIAVVFAPTSTSAKTASLDITDGSGKVIKVPLTGTGTAPTVSLSAASLTFPSTAAGASSTAQSVRVSNGGNAPLAIDLVLGGTNPGQFKVSGGTCVDGADLAAGASCTVQVTFAPTTGGSPTASLSVTTDLTTGNIVALSGTATAPADTQAPTAPTAVKGTVISQSAIDVTWTASTDNVAVAGYDIYRDANTTTPVGSVNGTTTTFHDTGLGASTAHTYRVVAFDGATPANRSALSTASASVTTQAAPDTTAPSIPSGVTGTVLSSSSIRVSWTASTDNVAVAGYKVFRDGGATPIATVPTGTTFTDTGLAASSAHTYTVSAFDGATPANESAKSAVSASVTTTAAADTTAPSIPTGVTGSATSSSQILVSWSPSTDNVAVAGYKVFRDGGATAVGTVTNGTTTFTDTGLAASSAHTYTVSAFDGATPANESAKSAPSASVTTQPAAQTGTGIALHGSSFSANATATTLNIPAPAGALSGDVEVMAIATRGAPAITAPTGWTLVRTDTNGTTMRQATFTHVVGATEPASYTWSLSASQAAAGGIQAYGGVSTVTPVDVHNGQLNTTSGTSATAPSVTTTKANDQVVGFFGNAVATSFTAPSGMAERGDVASTVGTFKVTLEGADQARPTAGATGTRVATAAAASTSIGQLVALAPSGGTTQAPPTDTQAPTVPTGVSGSATSSSAITVSWTASTDNVGVAGYRVFRDGGAAAIATVNTGTSFNDTGLAASSTHTYVVEAFDAAGNKATSTASAPVTTQAAATPPPPGIVLHGQSFAANATATTLSIPKPTGAQTGDVEIMSIATRGAPTITAPTGWTLVRTDTNGTVMRQAIYRHVVAATEPASYTWTLSASQAAAGGIMAYGGVSSVAPVDVNGGQFNASSGSVTAPSITTTKANTQLVGFFATGAATTFTAPTGMAERGDIASSAGTFKVTIEGAEVAKATAGATGTKVATSAAPAANVGQLVALAP